MSSENPTLLVIYPSSGDGLYSLLVADTGECLAQHICSHQNYAYGDLYGNRKERIDMFSERFGSVSVKFLSETDITEEELISRNKAHWESQHEKKDECETYEEEG